MKRLIFLVIAALLLVSCGGQTSSDTSDGVLGGASLDSVVSAGEDSAVGDEVSDVTSDVTSEEAPILSKGEMLAESLSLEERIGQMLLAAYPDVNAAETAQRYHLGGYIMFGREFKNSTPEEITSNIASIQSASGIPMLFAVDEEGGTVCRVSAYTQFRESRFLSPRSLFEKGGLEAIEAEEREKAALLSSLGINVNMAPVCDVTTDKSAFMYKRSLGQDAETTSEFVRTVLDANKNARVGCVLKHFPGYGNNADTHVGIAIDERSLDELAGRDLIPFQAGIDSGCGAILVSHTFINCLDPDYPATLSVGVHEYLRNEMGFDGVIVTDDLSMQAITDLYGEGEAAVLAVLAGNDLLCCGSIETRYQAILDAVNSGRIDESLITSAAARVLQWKYELGLIAE
ncbi:MAG: beta-hexosaminidase [Clostridia bacterium]|nr:beta-hexosaminidase [Clostridia bacterium]